MKQFWVFGGDQYYPAGGMDDWIGEYDTLEDSIAALLEDISVDKVGSIGLRNMWGHVYDTVKDECVFDSGEE